MIDIPNNFVRAVVEQKLLQQDRRKRMKYDEKLHLHFGRANVGIHKGAGLQKIGKLNLSSLKRVKRHSK